MRTTIKGVLGPNTIDITIECDDAAYGKAIVATAEAVIDGYIERVPAILAKSEKAAPFLLKCITKFQKTMMKLMK
jgi:hypothetical protein